MTEALVAFGANLGRPDLMFRKALADLDSRSTVTLRGASHLYRSEPWGLADQPDFINAVAAFETALSLRSFWAELQACEDRAGRTRDVRWGPRVLDLDLISYGDSVFESSELTVPHPRCTERRFVLEPLAELRPHWRHPGSRATPFQLLDALVGTGGTTRCERIPGTRLGEIWETDSCPQ